MKQYLKQFSFLVLLVSLVGFGVIFKLSSNKNVSVLSSTSESVSTPKATARTDQFTYSGKKGVDALTLLKKNTSIELDKSGMVISIAGRKVDSAKREFWSFSVNGQIAEVGPAFYKTADSDIITWKIDTY